MRRLIKLIKENILRFFNSIQKEQVILLCICNNFKIVKILQQRIQQASVFIIGHPASIVAFSCQINERVEWYFVVII